MRRHSGSGRIALLGAVVLVLLVGLGARPERALSEPEQSEPRPEVRGPAFAPGEILVKVKETLRRLPLSPSIATTTPGWKRRYPTFG